MRTKIIIGAIIGIIILIAVVIFIVNKNGETEDKYIGFWKENHDTYKVTKGNDGYYEIFTVGSSQTVPDFFGKYDKDKKILIVHVTGNNAGGLEDKNSLFTEERMNADPTFFHCWVYNEEKDQIDAYYKSDYDKGNLDLQKKENALTRVDDK
jgi:hypothetical protein